MKHAWIDLFYTCLNYYMIKIPCNKLYIFELQVQLEVTERNAKSLSKLDI